MRDSQRARLYGAEQACRRQLDGGAGDSVQGDTRLPQGDLEAAQAYVDHALQLVAENQGLFQLDARWTRRPSVYVHRSRSKATYYGGPGRIGLTPTDWSWRGLVVSHEVAHHLTVPALASHGGHFAHNFVTLTQLTEGEAVADALRDRFTAQRVIFTVAEQTKAALAYARKVRSEAASATGDGANAWLRVTTHTGRVAYGFVQDVTEEHIQLLNDTVPALEVAHVQQIDRHYRP